MLYLVLGCGILLIPLSLYAIFKIEKAKDNPNYKKAKIAAWVSLFIGAVCIIIPRNIWKSEKAVAEIRTKKEIQTVKILTLNEFVSAYSQNASLFNANANLDWSVESGEKADIGVARVNNICRIQASSEKAPNRELIGVMFFVSSTNSSKNSEAEMWESLFSAYTVVKTFEPNRSTESIPEFVAKLFELDPEHSITSGNLTYKLFQLGSNTIISISYNK